MDKISKCDVVIVGGGASGLVAAAELGMLAPDISVTVIEKNSEPGRKIRATGSGRCNITNTSAEGYDEIRNFFDRIGLVTRAYDNGLVYPYSESAADVAELLAARVSELGVRLITDAEVTRIGKAAETEANASECGKAEDRKAEYRRSSYFETEYSVKMTGGRSGNGKDINSKDSHAKGGRNKTETIRSAAVILACGGKAGPMFGTTGDGYRLARQLGHSIVTPVPVLTSIECREWDELVRPNGIMLAGTRTRGRVSLWKEDHSSDRQGKEPGAKAAKGANAAETGPVFEESGEIQFTKYGLSGICVFNMTRHMRYDRAAGGSPGDFCITADLFEDGDIRDFIRARRGNAFPGERAEHLLRTVLRDNIAKYVMAYAGIPADRALAELDDRDTEALGKAVHSLEFTPVSIRGWKEAQATSGGVSLDEICNETCESLLVPGLYITGELADRDYPCGGFNLSNAWITGMHAAAAAACRIREKDR